MIEAAVSAFGGGSIVTAVLTIFIKLWDRKLEADERKTMLLVDQAKMNIQALDALAHRTNNTWGNLSRMILLIVPQIVILTLLFMGYAHPDTVVWYGVNNEPWSFKFLFFEFTGAAEVTWRQFNGVVLVPTIFAQAGATVSYFLIGGMFSRR